jgi:hypothetical protein
MEGENGREPPWRVGEIGIETDGFVAALKGVLALGD